MLNPYLKFLLLTSSLIVLSACGGGDTSSSSESGSTPTNSGSTSGNGSGDNTSTEPTYDETTKGNSSTDKLEIHNVKNSEELRKALQDATSNHKHDKIILSAGTYKTTAGSVPGTFTYNDSDAYDLTITAKKGLNRNQVVIDGDKKDRIFHFSNTSKGRTVIVRNMTIKNGYSKFTVSDPSSSSAIFSSNTKLVLQNLLVTQNIADSKRHKIIVGDDKRYRIINKTNIISNFSKEEKLVIQNCEISNNPEAVTTLYVDDSSLDISNSIIKGNTVADSIISTRYLNVKKVTFTNNNASNNALISARYRSLIDRSTFSQNSSRRGLILTGDLSIIENSVIKNNTSESNLIYAGSKSSIKESIITDNQAKVILNIDQIINTTIKNNKDLSVRSIYSPAIRANLAVNTLVSDNSSETSLFANIKYSINNTFNNNQSSYSSTRDSSIVLKSAKVINTILANNKMQKDAEISGVVRNTYLDQNKLNAGASLINRDNIQSSMANININTDGSLKSSSVAINNGLNPDSQGFKDVFGKDATDFKEFLNKDRKGNKRVHDGTIDLGAYEYQ